MPDETPQPPASVQDALGNAGTLPVVDWKGTKYQLAFPDQKAKSALEELVAQQAVNECRAMKGVLDAAAYSELWNDTVTAIQTRQHRTLGPLWQKTVLVGGVASASKIMLALFQVKHPTLTEADVKAMIRDEPEQTTAALLRVIPSFFALVGREAGASPEVIADLTAQLTSALSPLAGRSPAPTG